MLSTRSFSELLELLHSTALEPDRWKLFLQRVCALTEARHGFFICSSSNLGLRVLDHGGNEDMAAAQQAYNATSGAIDPFRMPILLRPRTGVLEGDDLLPEAEFLETTLYRRILKPAGLRYLTAMALSVTPRRMEVLSFWRGLNQGPMGAHQRELLQLLLPHVRLALEVRQTLLDADRRCGDLRSLLDRADAAAFLLCSRGRMLELNAAAKAILKSGEVLEVRKGRLYPSQRSRHPEWLQLFSQEAAAGRGMQRGGAMLLHRAQQPGRPLHVVAAPWTASPESMNRAAMLVLVTDPALPRQYPDTVMKGLFRLTPAETEVANAYLTGYTTEEIAILRRVALSTVRSQLKVLLQKTNTCRQSELVRVLMTIPHAANVNTMVN